MFSELRSWRSPGQSTVTRRLVLFGGAAALVWPVSEAFAQAQLRIWGLWLDQSRPATNDLNRVRGTLRFRAGRDTSDRRLVAYGSGQNWRDTPRQCVELIKRYGYELRLPSFRGSNLNDRDFYNGSPTLGDAHEVAGRFATASNRAFTFAANGSTALPNPGSVISIAPFGSNQHGHVGILCNYSSSDVRSGEVRVKLFDQNYSANSWGEIRFLQSGRGSSARWYGSLRSTDGRAFYPATGWASPAA